MLVLELCAHMLQFFVASMSDGLWALDKNHRLLRHHQFTVKMSDSVPTSSGAFNSTSDDDWEVV
jgi:hypothetical protein